MSAIWCLMRTLEVEPRRGHGQALVEYYFVNHYRQQVVWLDDLISSRLVLRGEDLARGKTKYDFLLKCAE